MTVDEIKQTVSINDVMYKYGLEPNRKGFMRCPFHDEDTASFKVYSDTNSFYCFGCGESGDVIRFVQKIENIDFIEAVNRLGGNIELSFSEKREIANRKRTENQRRKALEVKEKAYWDTWDEWIRLDKNYRLYYPSNIDEELHPLFVEAIKKLPYQNYLIDNLNEEW